MLRLMVENGIGAILIKEKDRYVGIFKELSAIASWEYYEDGGWDRKKRR